MCMNVWVNEWASVRCSLSLTMAFVTNFRFYLLKRKTFLHSNYSGCSLAHCGSHCQLQVHWINTLVTVHKCTLYMLNSNGNTSDMDITVIQHTIYHILNSIRCTAKLLFKQNHSKHCSSLLPLTSWNVCMHSAQIMLTIIILICIT